MTYSYNTRIVTEISGWDGVRADPHRFGGTEFNLGSVEIGHIHGDYMVDIPFTRKIREALVAEDQARPHHLLADSGWISFYLRRDEDIAQAIRLLRLSYLHKRMARASREERSRYAAELRTLGFADSVLNSVIRRGADEVPSAN